LWSDRGRGFLPDREGIVRLTLVGCFSLAWLGCGEGGDLALSAGAPVTGAVAGTITDCAAAVPGATVVALVQQAERGQARPVDTRTGPAVTDRRGEYRMEIAPAFAVPGPASVRLLVTPPGGPARELPGGTVELGLGEPPRDTLRIDLDLGVAPGVCS
jgi:hypothetical protein